MNFTFDGFSSICAWKVVTLAVFPALGSGATGSSPQAENPRPATATTTVNSARRVNKKAFILDP
jgi:hypothetical protein